MICRSKGRHKQINAVAAPNARSPINAGLRTFASRVFFPHASADSLSLNSSVSSLEWRPRKGHLQAQRQPRRPDLGLRCASDPAGCLTRGHQCAHHTAEGDIARFVEMKVDERCDAGQNLGLRQAQRKSGIAPSTQRTVASRLQTSLSGNSPSLPVKRRGAHCNKRSSARPAREFSSFASSVPS